MKHLMLPLAVALLAGLALAIADVMPADTVEQQDEPRHRVSLRWLGQQLTG